MVGNPNAFRTGIACFAAGWWWIAKQKATPRGFQAAKLGFATRVDVDAQAFQDLRRPSAGPRSVSMLRDLHAGAGGHDRGRRGDVERLRRPSGSGGVEKAIRFETGLQSIHLLPHHRRRTHEFIDGGKTSRKESQQRADLRLVRSAGHDRLERRS